MIEGAQTGDSSFSKATIANWGVIRGGSLGIYALSTDTSQTIRNFGLIEGTAYSVITGRGADSVTNSGYLGGGGKVDLGEGRDVLTNTGLIATPCSWAATTTPLRTRRKYKAMSISVAATTS